MDFKEMKEQLRLLLNWNLIMESPVLSGNMQSFIQMGSVDSDYAILIQAPFYDTKEFRKKGVIIHTGESKNGKLHYAKDVNLSGGFGTHNKSEGWVNRVVNRCCEELASKYNCEMEGRLHE